MTHPRTIKEAAMWFKRNDPETAITEHMIRKLVVSGQVPSTKIGRKYVVCVEALESYFEHPHENDKNTTHVKRCYKIV